MNISSRILSDLTAHNKYARYDKKKKRRETWEELCYRNRNMHLDKYPQLYQEILDVYEKFVLPKKVLPSMRSLQFGGRAIEVSPNRIYNCAFLAIDHYKAFSEMMFLLLNGSGVGYSVQRFDVTQLPEIKKPTKSRRYLIGDSIIGWSDAVKALMEAYMKGKSLPLFDFSDIRVKDSELITSGGKAPGPEPIKTCLFQIQTILDRLSNGERLSSLEAHDICCHIADSVYAGGIRRAALLALFDIDDEEMLTCKYGEWYILNPQRGRSNNSAVVVRHKITEPTFKELWGKIKASGSGEPGLYLTNNPRYGTNPCCFTGDMKLRTSFRDIEFRELRNSSFIAKNYLGKECIGKVWSNGYKPVVELVVECVSFATYSLTKVRCTPDHRFMLVDGTECVAADLLGKEVKHAQVNMKARVVLVKCLAEEEEVFDFSLDDDTHWGVVNDLVAHNCEIALRNTQFCNLTEINASDIVDQKDLEERAIAAAFLGTLQGGYTNFHYLRDIWKKNTEKDALIGVGMTGIASGAVSTLDLTAAVTAVRKENKRIAGIIGINTAARTTCIKPSGTTSLVVGSSSGIHAWHSPFYIRNIRIGKTESLYLHLAKFHPELIQDDYFNPTTQAIIGIPVKAPEGSIFRSESAIDLLERVKKFTIEWIKPGHVKGDNSHNISATVSIKPEEWEDVGNWMWNNREYYNGLAVLPFSEHTYKQPPFEECDEVRYNELIGTLCELDLTKIVEEADNTNLKEQVACGGGSCEV